MYEFTKDLFVAEATIRFYGFRLQTRMAAIRLPGARLFLYSPVSLSDRLRDELEELGRVAFIVSPNKLHNLTLADYRTAFPEAKLFVPPGLPERRPRLSFDEILSGKPVPDWAPDLEHVLTRGSIFFSEALFFHAASRTLLVGDFVERIGPTTASSFARAVCRLFGVGPQAMASPEFRYYTTDTEAFAKSIARLLRWPIERIFLCHGELVEEKGGEVIACVAEALQEEVRGRGVVARTLFKFSARAQ